MRQLPASLLFFLGVCVATSDSTAVELHTFDFSGGDAQLIDTLDGLTAGRFTSIGAADEISVDISTNLGVLDFTTVSGNLGIDASTLGSVAPQTITLDFSSLALAPIRIHSIKMRSVLDIGSPFSRSQEFFLDPTITSQTLYRYQNGQSTLLGSYDVPKSGGAVLNIDNLQYGYHSIESVTVASEAGTTSVPEPSTALLLLAGLTLLGLIRIRD